MATPGKRRRIAEEDDVTLNAVGEPESDAPVASLDCLPPELLLQLFFWLDWISLLVLERVSVRLRDAVALHISKLRLLRVDISVWREFRVQQRLGLLPMGTGDDDYWVARLPRWLMPQPSEPMTALLSRMVNLRELHFDWYSTIATTRQDLMLTAVASASRHWPLLERLELSVKRPEDPSMDSNRSNRLDRDLLRQLCTNCVRLTSVTLSGFFRGDDEVEAIVTTLPAVRTLTLCVLSEDVTGSFLSQLPTSLHNLTIHCPHLNPRSVAGLSRCRELRTLDWRSLIRDSEPDPTQLVSVLVGCVHLEILSLDRLDEAFVACLPPDGLPKLRHLTVTGYCLNDSHFRRLVERLPGLESVSLGYGLRYNVSPQGLAPLGRLSALSVLHLGDLRGCVSDWLLTQLSAAPLVELQLPALPLLDESTCKRLFVPKALTVDGLLHLVRHCKSLRVLTLSSRSLRFTPEERISCGAGVQERDVEQAIRLFVDRVAVKAARLEYL